MIGGGSEAFRLAAQQVWGIAVSPSLVTYGAVITLGGIVLWGIFAVVSASSSGRQNVSPTTPFRRESTTSDSESTADTEQTPADRPSTESRNKQSARAKVGSVDDPAPSGNSSTGGVAHGEAWSSPTIRPLRENRFVNNTPTQSTKGAKFSLENISNKNRINGTSTNSRRNSLPYEYRRISRSSRTNSRRQVVEGLDVNTGLNWFSTESTWSVARVDFGVEGGSLNAGGELIHIDPIPSLADYKLVDSPIDFSSPSLLELLLGTVKSTENIDSGSSEQDLQIDSRVSGEGKFVEQQQRRPRDDEQGFESISESPPQETRAPDELSNEPYTPPVDSMDRSFQSPPTTSNLSTVGLLLSQPSESAGIDEQLGVGELDSGIHETGFGETNLCPPEFSAKDGFEELNQEIAGLENRIQEREQQLQEHLQSETNSEHRVSSLVPTFEDFSLNRTFLDSPDRLMNPGIRSPGVSEPVDTSVSFSQEFTIGREPTKDRSQFTAEPPSMFSEPDHCFNQAEDGIDLEESGLGSGIGFDPSPPEVEEPVEEIGSVNTEPDFGLW